MKKETLEKGLLIVRQIDFCNYRIKNLESRKAEYEQKEGIKLESGFDLDIKIPFEVFKDWFDSEITNELNKIEILEKDLEELK